jgi:mycothiol synthase
VQRRRGGSGRAVAGCGPVTPTEFARLVARNDGIDAFNESARMALASELPGRVDIAVHDGPRVIALAYAPDDAPVELAVHPDHRRRGHGTALIHRLVQQGETRFWAHGDRDGARGLAAACALQPRRTLLRLVRSPTSTAANPAGRPVTPNVRIRPFRADDLPGLLAVNARAFASHPEQGRMDQARFEQRAASAWFDPAGIFVAEREGDVVGFHWTKVDASAAGEPVGEVYVLAVDPAHEGQHLGATLLARGLEHLAGAGAGTVELYVEADNRSARSLYASHGFVEAGCDVLYVSTTPA